VYQGGYLGGIPGIYHLGTPYHATRVYSTLYTLGIPPYTLLPGVPQFMSGAVSVAGR